MDGGGEVIILTSMHRPVPSELLVTYLLPRHCAGGCFLCLNIHNCILNIYKCCEATIDVLLSLNLNLV